jgi:hypothetical protein
LTLCWAKALLTAAGAEKAEFSQRRTTDLSSSLRCLSDLCVSAVRELFERDSLELF